MGQAVAGTPIQRLNEVRMRQVENVLSVLMEGQSNLAQIMTEHAKQMTRMESRMERLEHNQTLILDELAFIKNYLTQDK